MRRAARRAPEAAGARATGLAARVIKLASLAVVRPGAVRPAAPPRPPAATSPNAHWERIARRSTASNAPSMPIASPTLCLAVSPLVIAAWLASLRRIVSRASRVIRSRIAASKPAWRTKTVPSMPTAAMSDAWSATNATKIASAPPRHLDTCARATAAAACNVVRKPIALANTAIS